MRQTQSGKRVHGLRDRAPLQQLFQYTRTKRESTRAHHLCRDTQELWRTLAENARRADHSYKSRVRCTHNVAEQCTPRSAYSRTHTKPARIPNKTPNYMHRQVKFVLSLARSVGLAGRVYAGGRASKPSRASDVLRATYSACTTGNIARLARVKQLSYSQLPNTT